MKKPPARRGMARSGIWPRIARNRTTAVLFAFLLAALTVLALRRSDVALEILAFLCGTLAGGVLAYLISYPLLRMTSSLSRLGRTTASRILGLSLAVALVLAITHFTGVSPSLDESGAAGALILGLAFGSGMGVIRRLSPPPMRTPEEEREVREGSGRELLIVGGALLVILALAGGLYVLVEYVAVPLTRHYFG